MLVLLDDGRGVEVLLDGVALGLDVAGVDVELEGDGVGAEVEAEAVGDGVGDGSGRTLMRIGGGRKAGGQRPHHRLSPHGSDL